MSRGVSYYIEEISKEKKSPGIYAFRGQSDGRWPLQSAAARRLLLHLYKEEQENLGQTSPNEEEKVKLGQTPPNKEEEVEPGQTPPNEEEKVKLGQTSPDLEDFVKFSRDRIKKDFLARYIKYHQDVLIEPACTNGFNLENGRELTDLDLLAKLQHFRAATGLLDFTRSALIALWFACETTAEDGKIFIINTNDRSSIGHITSERAKSKIGDLLRSEEPPLWYWEPVISGDAQGRILLQHSLFIIGKPAILDKQSFSVTTRHGDKEHLRSELEDKYHISEETLFKDIYGFTSVHRYNSPIRYLELSRKRATHYFISANKKYQNEDLQGAILDYDKVIETDPDYA